MKYDFNDVGVLNQVRSTLMNLTNEIDSELYLFSGLSKDYTKFYSQLRDKIVSYTKSERFSLLKEYFFQTSRDSVFGYIDSIVLNYINYLAKKRYSKKLLHVSDKTVASNTVIIALGQMLSSVEKEYDYISERYFV